MKATDRFRAHLHELTAVAARARRGDRHCAAALAQGEVQLKPRSPVQERCDEKTGTTKSHFDSGEPAGGLRDLRAGKAALGSPAFVTGVSAMVATSEDSFVHSLSVEIRYDKGLIYLNRCGILTQAVHEALGTPYRISHVPTVDYAELRNDPENITVRFGRKSVVVSQMGSKTAVPLELIVPKVWTMVKEDLRLDRVTRCGFRAQLYWPAETLAAARSRLMRTGLTSPSEGWKALFPAPTWAAYTALTTDRFGEVRIIADAVEHSLDGLIPAGWDALYPAAAVSLDLDFVYPSEGNPSYRLGPGQVTDFIRSRWEQVKTLRKRFAEVLTHSRLPS